MTRAYMAEDNSFVIMDNFGTTSPPSEMFVQGLPKTLVISLNSILSDNSVSSWNIKANSSGTQVWLRFNGNNNSKQMDMLDTTYRKVPPSKVNRDRERAKQRSERINDDSLDNSNSRTIDEVLNNPTPVFNINQPTTSDQSREISDSHNSDPIDSGSNIAHHTRSKSQQQEYSKQDSQKCKQYSSSHCTSKFKNLRS